jgi:hypothetical protein
MIRLRQISADELNLLGRRATLKDVIYYEGWSIQMAFGCNFKNDSSHHNTQLHNVDTWAEIRLAYVICVNMFPKQFQLHFKKLWQIHTHRKWVSVDMKIWYLSHLSSLWRHIAITKFRPNFAFLVLERFHLYTQR